MLQSRFTKMSLLAVMKHLLITAATQAEIQALINHLQHNWSSNEAYIFELVSLQQHNMTLQYKQVLPVHLIKTCPWEALYR